MQEHMFTRNKQYHKTNFRSKQLIKRLKDQLIEKNHQLTKMKETIAHLIANCSTQTTFDQTSSLPVLPTNSWWNPTKGDSYPEQTDSSVMINTKETQTLAYSSFSSLSERLNDLQTTIDRMRKKIHSTQK